MNHFVYKHPEALLRSSLSSWRSQAGSLGIRVFFPMSRKRECIPLSHGLENSQGRVQTTSEDQVDAGCSLQAEPHSLTFSQTATEVL